MYILCGQMRLCIKTFPSAPCPPRPTSANHALLRVKKGRQFEDSLWRGDRGGATYEIKIGAECVKSEQFKDNVQSPTVITPPDKTQLSI